MFKLILLILLALPGIANAAMCYEQNAQGTKLYRMVGTPTKYFPSTIVANIKPCAPLVTYTNNAGVYPGTVDPGCMASALNFCDSRWGGMRLHLNPNVPAVQNQCLYLQAKAKPPLAGGKYYADFQIYDARGPTGICPAP